MRKINVFVACALIVGAFIGGINLEKHHWEKGVKARNKVLDAYRGYVVSTEHMLDLLNHQYNWVDGLDHDGYYESRAEIEHLDSLGLLLEAERYAKAINNNSILINEIYGKN